jgi:catechol 2,3-dioxygenase-like lactoylglutathione lyase family enzyme
VITPAPSRLTPELGVTDIATSRHFYRVILDFTLVYDRPEEGFEYIRYEGCDLMLDQISVGRTWATGPLETPFGRGINLQLTVSQIDPLLARLEQAGIAIYLPVEAKTYRVGGTDVTQRQFCVQDPDGYLLRFCEVA